MVAIGAMLKDKRILITGAAGSIGSEMARQVAKFSPKELILIDQAETPMHDIRRYMNRNHANLRSEEHTSELQSRQYLVCRLLLEKTTPLLRPSSSPSPSAHL